MGTELARAVVRIEGDISDLEAALSLAHGEMEKAGKTFEQLGHTMTTHVTLPLVALGGFAVKEFGEQADAVARLDAVLTAAGGVTGTTTARIEELANALQQSTRFADDEVIAAASLLSTFHQVRNEIGAGNDIFDRAIQAASGLAAAMGEDLQSATLKLGRALEDPLTGLMMLRRAGIIFTAGEREQIKILVQHGQVLEAQRIILEKVEGKTRGVATAMAQTPFGHFIQAWNAVKDALKPVGGILAEVLVPIADLVKKAAEAFKNLDPAIQRIVVIIGTALAAIGPLLIAFATMAKLWAFLKTVGMLGLAPTLGLIVIALGALVAAGLAIVENWAWIKVQAVSLWTLIKDVFFTAIELILQKVADLGKLADKIPALAKALIPGLGTVASVMSAVGQAAQTMHDEVVVAHEKMLAESGAQLSALEADYQVVIDKMVEAMRAGQNLGKGGAPAREPPWAGPVAEALDKLKKDLATAQLMSRALGSSFDLAGAQASAYQAALQTVAEATNGVADPTGAMAALIDKLTLSFQKATAEGTIATLNKSLADANVQANLLGAGFDFAGAQASAFQAAIQELSKLPAAVLDKLGISLDQLKIKLAKAQAAQIQGNLTKGLHDIQVGFGGASDQANLYAQAIQAIATSTPAVIAALAAQGISIDDLKRKYQELQLKAQIGQFFQDEIGKMIDALFEGKVHFTEFIRDMLFQLSMLILKMEVLHLIGSIGGGDVGKFLGLPGFATGGFLPAGQLGIVGESGPELVKAGRSGMTVAPISNARGTAGESGGGERLTVPVTVNVQAIDQKGVSDFFEENIGAVGGAVMKAVQRSRLLRQGLG